MVWESEEHLVSEDLLEEAQSVFSSQFKQEAWFERSIPLSWQSMLNCTLCHFSPKKSEVTLLRSSRRSLSSIAAEAYLAKELGWKAQIAIGYLPIKTKELSEITSKVSEIMGSKIWLETLPLSRNDFHELSSSIEGISVPLETINKGFRRRFYQHLSLKDCLVTLDEAAGLKKGITIILGMGESLQDMEELHRIMTMTKLDRITFVPLLPHKNTQFRKGPSSFYITRWIAETRIAFPKMEIIAGTWSGRVAEIGLFMKAGVNAITKFQALRNFNNEDAKSIEQEIGTAGRTFVSTLTNLKELERLKKVTMDEETKNKLGKYIKLLEGQQ